MVVLLIYRTESYPGSFPEGLRVIRGPARCRPAFTLNEGEPATHKALEVEVRHEGILKEIRPDYVTIMFRSTAEGLISEIGLELMEPLELAVSLPPEIPVLEVEPVVDVEPPDTESEE